MARFIDLSATFSDTGDPKGTHITYYNHEQRAATNAVSRGLKPTDFKKRPVSGPGIRNPEHTRRHSLRCSLPHVPYL